MSDSKNSQSNIHRHLFCNNAEMPDKLRSDRKIVKQNPAALRLHKIHRNGTVGTPYNTAPYITGSNIARLGHGSQNSWSKLWIPIVKSAPVRIIFTWKSVPKKSIHGSSDIYLGTQWKQRHDSPWSYQFRCHCHLTVQMSLSPSFDMAQ